MALPLRPRSIPQCTACLRSYAWSAPAEVTGSSSVTVLKQQTRGKKKMPNNSGTTTVRLLKGLPGFGRKGAIIPVPPGQMRNQLYPKRLAEYITIPELRTIRESGVPIERDYTYGKKIPAGDLEPEVEDVPDPNSATAMLREVAKAKEKEVAPEKLDPNRGTELLEIFVKPVLQFFRQPIIEEAESKTEEAPEPETKEERRRTASSAAADLLAARTSNAPKPKQTGPQSIYGSVSAHDILVHIRASIATNDESARVILAEDDIRFLEKEAETERKVKHVGDFTIEVRVKGASEAIKRTVRVIPQEASS